MSQPNAEVVEAFIAATQVALAELAALEVALHGEAKLTPTPPNADVYAALALRGGRPGLLLCGFPAALAERLAQRMLPLDQAITPALVADALGELTNVIAGQAKTMLKDTAHHFHLSTPVMAREACPPLPDNGGGTELRFREANDEFWLWVQLPR